MKFLTQTTTTCLDQFINIERWCEIIEVFLKRITDFLFVFMNCGHDNMRGLITIELNDVFAHITTTVSFPLQVAENVVFEPYIQHVFENAGGDVDDFYLSGTDSDGDLSAGVSLSVSF